VNYIFKASPTFWKKFNKLPDAQQKSAREVYKVFKTDPYDPSLKTHKIAKLSAVWGKTIMSVTIEGNLRAVFFQQGKTIFTVDIGTHDIYK
jgi:mRNA-degrading endonuclease YafQ of YafQ-DinJ toxin-antitoxin module